MSPDFEKWKERYRKRWATKAQLRTLVTLEVLTPEEYETITSEVYAPTAP